jgi:predicted DNA-binding transcriptional regulator AlpA
MDGLEIRRAFAELEKRIGGEVITGKEAAALLGMTLPVFMNLLKRDENAPEAVRPGWGQRALYVRAELIEWQRERLTDEYIANVEAVARRAAEGIAAQRAALERLQDGGAQ